MASTIQVLGTIDSSPVATFKAALPVKAGAASSIKAGYLVIVDIYAGYVKAAADGCDTDSFVIGVACQDSTETVSVDGTVLVTAASQLLVGLKAKTPANLTAALCLTNKYVLDVIAGAYTLDQGTTAKGIFTLISFDNTTDGNCVAVLSCNKF